MPHEIHFPILSQLGLNESETLVYELLLELGPKSAQELLTPSGLGRGNLYNVLTSLKKKELVFEEPGAKTVFKAVDPEVLRGLAKAKMAATQDLLNQVNAAMPTLKSHYNLVTKQPTIRVFEGIEGIKEVYNDMLEENQNIIGAIGPDSPPENLRRWLNTVYIKNRVKKNIKITGLVSATKSAEELQKKSQQELREMKLIDPEKYPFQGEVNIFGKKIAFLDYKKSSMIAMIVEDENLAITFRSIIMALFEIL